MPMAALGPRRHEQVIWRTRQLSRGVLRGARETEAIAVANVRDRIEVAKAEREEREAVLRARIRENSELIKTAEEGAAVADEAIKRAYECLSRVQRHRRTQATAMKVCERRLEIREARPAAERIKDRPQEALEAELRAYNSAWQDQSELEAEVRHALEPLPSAMAELGRDAARRRLLVEADHAAIVADLLHPANCYPVPPPEAVEMVEVDGQMMTPVQALLCQVASHSDAIDRLRKQADDVIVRTTQECTRATAFVTETLARRTAQTEAEAKYIRRSIPEVDETIEAAERSLATSRKKLDTRDRRGLATYDGTKAMLEDLRGSRLDLQRELQQKNHLLSIEESCRKVTPQWASAQELMLMAPIRERQRRATIGNAGAGVGEQKRRRPASAPRMGRSAAAKGWSPLLGDSPGGSTTCLLTLEDDGLDTSNATTERDMGASNGSTTASMSSLMRSAKTSASRLAGSPLAAMGSKAMQHSPVQAKQKGEEAMQRSPMQAQKEWKGAEDGRK